VKLVEASLAQTGFCHFLRFFATLDFDINFNAYSYNVQCKTLPFFRFHLFSVVYCCVLFLILSWAALRARRAFLFSFTAAALCLAAM